MKKITSILVLLAVIHTPALAEIFKCKFVSEKTVYQSTPCPSTAVSQDLVKVKKMDADKIAEAQARFAAWKADLAVREAAEVQAEKERREELARQETVDALNRSAMAQEALAEAAKRPVVINQIIQPYPHYMNTHPNPDRHHHRMDHKGLVNPNRVPER
jgi:Skp family chaperone for outer membrane proteins